MRMGNLGAHAVARRVWIFRELGLQHRSGGGAGAGAGRFEKARQVVHVAAGKAEESFLLCKSESVMSKIHENVLL